MRYDRLRAKVEAAIRAFPSGAALVILNDDGTWTAAHGTPRITAVFRTESRATAYLHAHTAPSTPIIIIDI